MSARKLLVIAAATAGLAAAAPWAIYGVFLIVFMYVMPGGVAGFFRIVAGRLKQRLSR